MKMGVEYDVERNRRRFILELTTTEIGNVQLSPFDQYVLNECEDSDSIADMLLALELITRRIEEQNAKRDRIAPEGQNLR